MLTSPSGELLPSDLLVLVLAQLSLVRNIKRVKSVCKAFLAAAPEAEKAHRRVCFEHASEVLCVAAAPDGRIITGAWDNTVKVWRNGACERTIQAHIHEVTALAVLPGGARFVSAATAPPPRSWPPRAPSAAESAWELRSQISDLEQQRDEALQMNAALARRVVLERVEADRAAAAATAVTWASQDPEGYVI